MHIHDLRQRSNAATRCKTSGNAFYALLSLHAHTGLAFLARTKNLCWSSRTCNAVVKGSSSQLWYHRGKLGLPFLAPVCSIALVTPIWRIVVPMLIACSKGPRTLAILCTDAVPASWSRAISLTRSHSPESVTCRSFCGHASPLGGSPAPTPTAAPAICAGGVVAATSHSAQ